MAGRRVYINDPKQPGEVIVISVDFNPGMVLAGESVPNPASVAVQITARTGYSGAVPGDYTAWMLVVGATTVSNNVVAFEVANGSDGIDYVCQVRATTSFSRIEEADVILPVRERPSY